MPSTFTTNTGIEKIASGEQTGTWGDTTNTNFDIIDRALNGSITISLSGTTHTLTTSSGVTSDGQFAVIVFGGSPSGTNTVTISPDTAQKLYAVRNTTAQTVVMVQGSGATVSIPAGTSKIVYSNGAGATAAVFDLTNTFAMGAAAITGGTIDGVAIGGTTPATVLNVDNIRIDGNTLSSTNTDGNIVLAPNGTGEVDIAKVDIDGGTIDGTPIGGATPAAGAFTTLSASGDVSIADKIVHTGDADTAIRFPAADTVTVETAGAERMRINSSGNVFIGTTSTVAVSGAGSGIEFNPSGFTNTKRNTTDAASHFQFANPNGIVGSITTSGSATAYNTSSDYRLKEDVQPISGAVDRVMALNPVNYAWKADGSRADGFLAHEAQAVVPEAVTGEKDAVDADGNPVYQGIDHGKIVPLLTAALRKALADIATLKAEVAALKGGPA